MSKLSDRPQTRFRQRDSTGHLMRRGKIISRGPGQDGAEYESTDFDEALRPGQIDTAPRMRNAEPMQGTPNSGSLENAANGTKSAAATQEKAATTFEQAATTFATAAQSMIGSAGSLGGLMQGFAAAMQQLNSKVSLMQGQVNRLVSQQGGSGS